MIKNKKVICFIILGFLLTACNTQNKGDNNIHPVDKEAITVASTPKATLPPPTNTPLPTPTPTADQLSRAYLDTLERIEITELEGNIDAETSRKNSNFLNFGYLEYDKDGNIYYINKNDNYIYCSDASGATKRKLGEVKVAEAMLQVADEWLYYFNNIGRVERVNILTGETEVVIQDAFGQFIIADSKIYMRDEGFCVFELDGGNRVEMPNTEKSRMYFYSRGNSYWVCQTGHMSNIQYLLQYDGKTVKALKQRGTFPLLAGNYLSVVEREKKERHIYNLVTGQDINLRTRTGQTVASDGNVFYFAGSSMMNNDEYKTPLYCWDGTEREEIIMVEGARSIDHVFLTPEKLYYMPQMKIDGKFVYQLWYYDLLTGETGQIY